MQNTQPDDFSEALIKEMEQRQAQVSVWLRDLGFLEAWKKVAERSVHLVFCSLPIFGPTLSDQMKKDAVDALYRHTWWVVCEGLTSEERIEAWREHRDAINEYSLALIEKAAVERCEPAPSGTHTTATGLFRNA